MTKISKRDGSPDPDPHENVIDLHKTEFADQI
jgi:hypothetical protein